MAEMVDELVALLGGEAPFPGIADFPWGREAARIVAGDMATDGAHDATHLGRVFNNARRITEGETERGGEVDWEIVAAAVLFHDAVNLPKDAPDRASASARSAELAREFFEGREGFEPGRLELVGEAIVSHSYSQEREPESREAKIVCDADRLDALGAAGLARVFYVSGSMDGEISHPTDPFAETRELDDTQYAIDHFFEKLLKLREQFWTATGREMADQRHEYLVEFLERFRVECQAVE
jgi:uncharacterized protein